MSEFPSQTPPGTPVAGSDIPTDALVLEDGGRNPLILLGAVAVLAAVAALAYFLLIPAFFGADDPESLTILPPPDSAADAELADAAGEVDAAPGDDADAALGTPPLAGQPVPETFEVFSSRDPFQQLVIERPVGGSADDAADDEPTDPDDPDDELTADAGDAAQPTVSTPDTDSGDLSAEPTEEPTASPSPGGDGTSGQGTRPQQAYTPGEYWERPGAGTIEVTFVATTITNGGSDAVVMAIDGTEHEVVEGEIFAERFWLLDIHDDCGTFLFGDSRFTLCVGETIMK